MNTIKNNNNNKINNKILRDRFILKSNLKYGSIFDYSKVDYKNNQTKVIIICDKHGEFKQSPSSHVNSKTGCPECGLCSRKISNIEFIDRANIKHNNLYDYCA